MKYRRTSRNPRQMRTSRPPSRMVTRRTSRMRGNGVGDWMRKMWGGEERPAPIQTKARASGRGPVPDMFPADFNEMYLVDSGTRGVGKPFPWAKYDFANGYGASVILRNEDADPTEDPYLEIMPYHVDATRWSNDPIATGLAGKIYGYLRRLAALPRADDVEISADTVEEWIHNAEMGWYRDREAERLLREHELDVTEEAIERSRHDYGWGPPALDDEEEPARRTMPGYGGGLSANRWRRMRRY